MWGIDMKQGNQCYLEIQLTDKDNELLDVSLVEKVQFNIDRLTKVYDGESEEVEYDEDTKTFKIWLTEEETFGFGCKIKFDSRILFKNGTIMGTYVEQQFIYNSLNSEKLGGNDEQ